MAGSTTAYAHRHEADSGTDSSTWRTFRGARWDESRRDVWISSAHMRMSTNMGMP